MDHTKWILLDTETTGLASPIFVVDIAAQRMRGWQADGPPFRRLLNQNVNIPPESARVHGYTRQILERDGEPPKDVYKAFEEYADGLPIVAYNLQYDLDQVLIPEWQRLGIEPIGQRGFCAMRLTQRLLDPVPAGNCKLQTLRQYYRLPERGAHTALGDVQTVVDLLEHVLEPIASQLQLNTWEAVHEFTRAQWFPSHITFGKFKGRHFREAHSDRELRDWFEWLAKSSNARSSSVGRWYLARLGAADDQSDKFSPMPVADNNDATTTSDYTVVIYIDAELEDLKRIVKLARERLANVEAEFTKEKRAIDSTQSKLFKLLEKQYRLRDNLQLKVTYRQRYLDVLLQQGEDEAEVVREEYGSAQQQSENEYQHASQSAAGRKELNAEEEQEQYHLWRKLVLLYHPDRFATDSQKAESYRRLTSEINRARDDGDIDRLREIANDPEGFMARNGFGALDFSDTSRELTGLRKLYDSLQFRIVSTLEALNTLRESPEFELHRFSQQPGYLESVAELHSDSLATKIAELELKADQLNAEILELTGANSID